MLKPQIQTLLLNGNQVFLMFTIQTDRQTDEQWYTVYSVRIRHTCLGGVNRLKVKQGHFLGLKKQKNTKSCDKFCTSKF